MKKLSEQGELSTLMDLAKKKCIDKAWNRKGPRMKKSLAKRGQEALKVQDAKALVSMLTTLSGALGIAEDEEEFDEAPSDDENEVAGISLDLAANNEQFLIASEQEVSQRDPSSVQDVLNEANERMLAKIRGDSKKTSIETQKCVNSDNRLQCRNRLLFEDSSDEELTVTEFRTVE